MDKNEYYKTIVESMLSDKEYYVIHKKLIKLIIINSLRNILLV